MSTLSTRSRASNLTQGDALQEVESVDLTIEERRVDFASPENWRSHRFTSLAAIPERLDASFGDAKTAKDNVLMLLQRVRDLCKSRRMSSASEEPYYCPSSGSQNSASTVLRSLRISIRYLPQAPVAAI